MAAQAVMRSPLPHPDLSLAIALILESCSPLLERTAKGLSLLQLLLPLPALLQFPQLHTTLLEESEFCLEIAALI